MLRSGAYSNPATSRARRSGFVIGAKRARTTPTLSTRNFVKFHFMLLPSKPPFCCLSQTEGVGVLAVDLDLGEQWESYAIGRVAEGSNLRV